MVLVDFDRVEEANITRQNFYPDEIGKYKSAALAERLSTRFDRPITYATVGVQDLSLPGSPTLIIGCVDNGVARAAIAELVLNRAWWVDTGNGDNYGQILIGNGAVAEFHHDREIVTDLPLPSIQRPEILQQTPPIPQLPCEAQPEQSPTVNQVMASVTIEVVRRLYLGTCPWIQVLIDLEHMSLTPVMATPEVCREIMHTRSKDKVRVIYEKRKEDKQDERV